MRKCVALSLALALLALQACSDSHHEDPLPFGTCSPAAHTAADPTGAESFCTALFAAACDRAFAGCGAELDLGSFSSASECRAYYASLCNYVDFSNDWYDSPCGDACINYIERAPCSALVGDVQACSEASGTLPPPPPPPPPACIATIYAGTISDTIVVGDPLYDGSHARTYCLSLTAGHSVTLETSAPLSGTEIYDTILYLIAPDGTLLASDDDGGVSLYSRIYVASLPASGTYHVIVTGFSSYDVGSYRLTVTAP